MDGEDIIVYQVPTMQDYGVQSLREVKNIACAIYAILILYTIYCTWVKYTVLFNIALG